VLPAVSGHHRGTNIVNVEQTSNLLARTPKRLHEEITADHNNMICAETRDQVTFTRLLPSQWKSAHNYESGYTTNSSEGSKSQMRKIDSWNCSPPRPVIGRLTSQPDQVFSKMPEIHPTENFKQIPDTVIPRITYVSFGGDS
jgi:hypothetical protein